MTSNKMSDILYQWYNISYGVLNKISYRKFTKQITDLNSKSFVSCGIITQDPSLSFTDDIIALKYL